MRIAFGLCLAFGRAPGPGCPQLKAVRDVLQKGLPHDRCSVLKTLRSKPGRISDLQTTSDPLSIADWFQAAVRNGYGRLW